MHTCDRSSVEIAVTLPGEEQTVLEEELTQHQQLLQDGYNSLWYDRQLSNSSWENKFIQTNLLTT